MNHGGLRSNRYPAALALHKHIHPDPFSAAILAVQHALFDITALHNGDVSQDFYVHGTDFDGLRFVAPGFYICEKPLFRYLAAVVADSRPIVGDNLSDLIQIAGRHGVSPIAFDLFDPLRDACALGQSVPRGTSFFFSPMELRARSRSDSSLYLDLRLSKKCAQRPPVVAASRFNRVGPAVVIVVTGKEKPVWAQEEIRQHAVHLLSLRPTHCTLDPQALEYRT